MINLRVTNKVTLVMTLFLDLNSCKFLANVQMQFKLIIEVDKVPVPMFEEAI